MPLAAQAVEHPVAQPAIVLAIKMVCKKIAYVKYERSDSAEVIAIPYE